AGSGAVHVGENEYSTALIEAASEFDRLRQQHQRIGFHDHGDARQQRGGPAHHMVRAVNQAFAERAVSDDQYSNHGGLAMVKGDRIKDSTFTLVARDRTADS